MEVCLPATDLLTSDLQPDCLAPSVKCPCFEHQSTSLNLSEVTFFTAKTAALLNLLWTFDVVCIFIIQALVGEQDQEPQITSTAPKISAT